MHKINGIFRMEIKKLSLVCLFFCFEELVALPVNSDPRIVIVPLSAPNLYPQTRGPLDFIGNWIQSSGFFPLELNVPDTFSAVGNTLGGWANNVGSFAQNIGSGLQGFTQNVGSGIQGFTQNVGSGINNFAQGLTQRIPFLATIIRPTGSTQRFVLLIPAENIVDQNRINQNVKSNFKVDFNANPELMEIFP